MIISLQLDGGKQGNPKIRQFLDKKIREKIRPRMVEKPKPKPKKEIKTSYNMIPIFLNWLENNANKFDFMPYVNSITEDNVEIFFHGVSPKIVSAEFYQQSGGYAGFRIAAKHNGVFYDWLLDFDVILMRDKNGYYCDFCSPCEYFKDEESLVIQHLLDGVLRWCNENLDQAKGISFSGNSEKGFYLVSFVLTDKGQYISFQSV